MITLPEEPRAKRSRTNNSFLTFAEKEDIAPANTPRFGDKQRSNGASHTVTQSSTTTESATDSVSVAATGLTSGVVGSTTADSGLRSTSVIGRLAGSLFGGKRKPVCDEGSVSDEPKEIDRLRSPEVAGLRCMELLTDPDSEVPTMSYLPNVASEALGARVTFCSDEFYGRAENLLIPSDPADTDVANGWATRRRRQLGHDWVIIKLAEPCYIRGLDIEVGGLGLELAPQVSVEAGRFTDLDARLDAHLQAHFPGIPLEMTRATYRGELLKPEVLESVNGFLDDEVWTEVLGITRLRARDGDHAYFHLSKREGETEQKATHVRLNLFPDGAIRRLRVHGECNVSKALLEVMVADSAEKEVDLAAMANGGMVLWSSVARSDALPTLTYPYPAEDESDCWSCPCQPFRPPVYFPSLGKKPRFNGEEWVLLKLACTGVISRVEIDTTNVVGNVPARVTIMGCEVPCVRDMNALQQMEFFQNEIDGWSFIATDVDVHANCIMNVQVDATLSEPGELEVQEMPAEPDTEESAVEAPLLRSHLRVPPAKLGQLTHVRVHLIPDGAIGRVRIYGSPAPDVPGNPFLPPIKNQSVKRTANRRKSTLLLYNSLSSTFK